MYHVYSQTESVCKVPLGSRTWQLLYSGPVSVGVGLLFVVVLYVCPKTFLELKTWDLSGKKGQGFPHTECPVPEATY